MRLYKHQKKLIDKNPLKCLIAHATGTGKTLTAIELVEKNRQFSEEALVVCPKSIKQQWAEQITGKKGMYYNIITKEEFRRDAYKLLKYKYLIIDEAHYFAGIKSQLTKKLLKYINVHQSRCVYLLTATPYLSTPWNIYCLAKYLGYNWNYMKFKNTFFQDVTMGTRTIPVIRKEINGRPIEDYIGSIVKGIGDVVKLEECIDMPDQIFQTEYFDLTKEQQNAISNLEDINHIVRWTKIHQICGGSLKGDSYTKNQFFKSEKADRLVELCKQHKKLAIVCRYNNEIDCLYDKVSKFKDCYIIRGDVKDRHQVVKWAEKNDNCAVFIQAACSEGYELPSISLMVFYSYDFSLKNYIQIIGRIQRINNIKKNVYKSLIVAGTIDADVYNTIQRKEDFQLAIYEKNRTTTDDQAD